MYKSLLARAVSELHPLVVPCVKTPTRPASKATGKTAKAGEPWLHLVRQLDQWLNLFRRARVPRPLVVCFFEQVPVLNLLGRVPAGRAFVMQLCTTRHEQRYLRL